MEDACRKALREEHIEADEEAFGDLATELTNHLKKLYAGLPFEEFGTDPWRHAAMLSWIDSAALAYLGSNFFGEHAQSRFAEFRDRARAAFRARPKQCAVSMPYNQWQPAWAGWYNVERDFVPTIAIQIARILARIALNEQQEEARNEVTEKSCIPAETETAPVSTRNNTGFLYPTLPLPILKFAIEAIFRRGRTIAASSLRPEITNSNGGAVAEIRAPYGTPPVPAWLLTHAGLERTGQLATHRLFRDLPLRAIGQAQEEKVDPAWFAPVVKVAPGAGEYSRVLGIGVKNSHRFFDALDALQYIAPTGDVPHANGPLLTWGESATPDRRKHELKIELNASYYTGGRRGKLVPIPHLLPRFVGRPNEYSAQATLQLITMIEFRSQAHQLAESGFVTIPELRWVELLGASGVPLKHIYNILADAWVNDGDDGRAFLKPVADDKWTLADAHNDVLAVLIQGGQIDLNAKAAGKRSAAARQRKLRLRSSAG